MSTVIFKDVRTYLTHRNYDRISIQPFSERLNILANYQQTSILPQQTTNNAWNIYYDKEY